MYTYIIESQGYYKIGKTSSVKDRVKSYNTHNPSFELIFTIKADCERFLIDKYEEKRFKYDWFILSQEDVDWIRNNEDVLLQNTSSTYISAALRRERLLNEQIRKEEDAKFEEFMRSNS